MLVEFSAGRGIITQSPGVSLSPTPDLAVQLIVYGEKYYIPGKGVRTLADASNVVPPSDIEVGQALVDDGANI
jgi:hypothetical protein